MCESKCEEKEAESSVQSTTHHDSLCHHSTADKANGVLFLGGGGGGVILRVCWGSAHDDCALYPFFNREICLYILLEAKASDDLRVDHRDDCRSNKMRG
jgi:hypothetical protein